MGLRALVVAGAVVWMQPSMRGQAAYTATRAMDLQVGGYFSFGQSNYLPWDTQGNPAPLSDLTRKLTLMGAGGYASLDFTPHLGAEINFRRMTPRDDASSQTTYELGGRYIFTHRYSWLPYARVSYGRGTYNYTNSVAKMSYNLFGVAGGVDYHLMPALTLRGEYEWQSWMSVPIRNPSPQVFSVGVAYHFH